MDFDDFDDDDVDDGPEELDADDMILLDMRTYRVTVERTKGVESVYYEDVTVHGLSYAIDGELLKFFSLIQREVGGEMRPTVSTHRALRNWVDIEDITAETRQQARQSKAIN
jgi:hypothetical protein